MEKTLLSSSKMKDISWEREDYLKFDKDYPYGYPWPPRYYTCSFCQREFKSAQALGGHMNIHRKDRARLRDLSPDNNPFLSSNSNQNPNPNPTSNLNSKPNPNPNSMISLSTPSSSCPTNNIYAQQYSLVSLSLATIPPSQEVGKCKKMSSFDEQRVMILESSTSTKEVVRLDLELCLGDAKEDDDDDLDLELRLGF